jgi:hypothetical protein
MRKTLLVLILAAFAARTGFLAAQEKLTPGNLPDFLARYDTNFVPLEAAFTELVNENLPLRDEEGQPLGRRPIEDRRQALFDLQRTAQQLAANPQDLVLVATLAIRTETLSDDLFDLSQISYDNDREQLAKRLSDLQITMDHNKDLLADYLLSLAARKQERLQQLEKANTELQRKLQEYEKKTRPGELP